MKKTFPYTLNLGHISHSSFPIFIEQREKANIKKRDFPGGRVVKDPPANAADTGSSPGPGRSHMPQSN